MAWVRLDEDFASHPKVVEAGPLGIALQVAGLCYCNRHLTDGRIPRGAARALLDFEGIAVVSGMSGEDVEPAYVIGLLVDAGLWHEPGHDCPDCPQIERGYLIHDYLEQQPSREDVLRKREQAAAAGRKGGQAKRTGKRSANGPSSETLGDTSSGPEAGRQAKPEAESKPGPGPGPVEVQERESSRKRADRAHRLPDRWNPAPEPELVAAIGEPAARREFAKFVDYWRAAPGAKGRKVDWQATWRNWLRRAAENGTTGGRPSGGDPPARPVREYDPDDAEARFQALTGEGGG